MKQSKPALLSQHTFGQNKLTHSMLTRSALISLVALSIGACGDADKASDQSSATQAQTQSIEAASDTVETLSLVPFNSLSEAEKAEGFQLLFDGESFKGWRGFNRSEMPAAWVIDDGALHMVGAANFSPEQEQSRGDIVFDEQFSDFVLKLEWKISQNGNSGIFYLGKESSPDAEYDFIWKTAPEMQILDNDGHPDANMGKDGNRQAGSLYDLVPAIPQNAKPVGEWNSIEIHVKDRSVKHVQNGKVVVEYTMDTPEWEAMIADSKFPGLNPNWAQVPESGYIGLQDHSDPVWFRNIKIKAL